MSWFESNGMKLWERFGASLVFILALALPRYVHAGEMTEHDLPPIRSSLQGDTITSDAQIYLMTVGVGDQIYARYGHTMIRVHETMSASDSVYNWGMFDFADPGFAWKFFTGVLQYRIGVQSFSRTIDHYESYEMRPVWEEPLNLTARQRRELLKRIAWNMRPENVRYSYQYFTNNCATKPRDYLDEALGGAIKTRFENEPAGVTWRWYVREYLNDNPIVGTGLDVLMNGNIDRPMSRWDEMFFPLKLREYLREMPAIADNGKPDFSRGKLLGESQEIVSLPQAPVGDKNNFVFAHFLFGVPVFFFFLATIAAGWIQGILRKGSPDDWTGRIAWNSLHGARWVLVRLAQAFLGVGLTGWALLSGALGTIALTAWILSAHTDLHHNANLWLFWPSDFLFVAVGYRAIRNAVSGRAKKRPILTNSVRFYSGIHVLALLTMVSLRQTGMIHQEVDRVLVNMGTLAALIYVACWFGMVDFGSTDTEVSQPGANQKINVTGVDHDKQ